MSNSLLPQFELKNIGCFQFSILLVWFCAVLQAFYTENNMWYRLHRTWRQAENFCLAIGGHLASIRSEVEQSTVLSAIRAEHSEEDFEYWLGLNETPDFSGGSLRPRWEWADGQPFLTGTTSFFHPTIDHSSDGLFHYDCVVLEPVDGHWIKQSCYLTTGWICEVPKGLYPEGRDIAGLLPPDSDTLEANGTKILHFYPSKINSLLN